MWKRLHAGSSEQQSVWKKEKQHVAAFFSILTLPCGGKGCSEDKRKAPGAGATRPRSCSGAEAGLRARLPDATLFTTAGKQRASFRRRRSREAHTPAGAPQGGGTEHGTDLYTNDSF